MRSLQDKHPLEAQQAVENNDLKDSRGLQECLMQKQHSKSRAQKHIRGGHRNLSPDAPGFARDEQIQRSKSRPVARHTKRGPHIETYGPAMKSKQGINKFGIAYHHLLRAIALGSVFRHGQIVLKGSKQIAGQKMPRTA